MFPRFQCLSSIRETSLSEEGGAGLSMKLGWGSPFLSFNSIESSNVFLLQDKKTTSYNSQILVRLEKES